MMQKILAQRIRIAKKWPFRLLNYCSLSYQKAFLIRKTGKKVLKPFDLAATLNSCKKIILVAPNTFQEQLIAYPLLHTLIQNLPPQKLVVITPQEHLAFLQVVLQNNSSPVEFISYVETDLYWGEKAFEALKQQFSHLQGDVMINLQMSQPPLLAAILRGIQAKLSITLSEDEFSTANITLLPKNPYNLLRHYTQILDLWRFVGNNSPLIWPLINSESDNINEAQNRFRQIGVTPKQVGIFLWQNEASEKQREAYTLALKDMHAKGIRAILVFSGNTSPEGPIEFKTLPQLGASSLGKMLALFSQAAEVYGVNCDLLHLANLSGVPVQGYFLSEDAPFDTSFFNPRCEVQYLSVNA